MKIKIYILTWKDKYALDRNLRSLFDGYSNLPAGVDIHINVINNHTDFYISPEWEGHVKVIHNVAQPDFATAMLGRMWNIALIHGFKDLDNPDADIVVTSQDDTVWNSDWIPNLLSVMSANDFYADDAGDMVCAYTTDAIKKIGLWDERFHYGFGEGDYFLRAVKYLPNRSSINDHAHGRVWNATMHLARRPEPDSTRYTEQNRAHQFRNLSWTMWRHKWSLDYLEGNWSSLANLKKLLDSIDNTQFILYPYFELKVENLKDKGFIVP